MLILYCIRCALHSSQERRRIIGPKRIGLLIPREVHVGVQQRNPGRPPSLARAMKAKERNKRKNISPDTFASVIKKQETRKEMRVSCRVQTEYFQYGTDFIPTR